MPFFRDDRSSMRLDPQTGHDLQKEKKKKKKKKKGSSFCMTLD